jgi:hypothetical protein
VVTGIPVEIPGYIWAGLVGIEVVEVAGSERAQSQPGCLKRVFRAEHRPMVAEEAARRRTSPPDLLTGSPPLPHRQPG